MAFVDQPVFALIAGEGGQRQHLETVTAELGLSHRVRFLGRVDDVAMRKYYAHALGVYFGPRLEDYGFITLEAMLSSRPVITCLDSGGPTNIVRHGETGIVAEAEPASVADAINRLWSDKAGARAMGAQGRQFYDQLNISWQNVVNQLLAD